MFRQIFIFFYSIYGWLLLFLAFFFHLILSGPWMIFAKNPIKFHQRTTVPVVKTLFFLTGLKLIVKGKDNIPKDTPAIFMSNHQSNYDVMSYTLAVPTQVSFLTKKELFRIPLVGWDMRLQGQIGIDRDNIRSAIKVIDVFKKRFKGGGSVVIFPEGTRSLDGNLLPFKRFVFLLAKKSGVPIIPCGVEGSLKVMPKVGLKLQPGSITVRFGTPIDTSTYELDDLVLKVESDIRQLMG